MPDYQDLSLKLNFPVGRSGNLSIFGLGGKGYVEILTSKVEKPDDDEIYGAENMDEHFRTAMGVAGKLQQPVERGAGTSTAVSGRSTQDSCRVMSMPTCRSSG